MLKMTTDLHNVSVIEWFIDNDDERYLVIIVKRLHSTFKDLLNSLRKPLEAPIIADFLT